jgi:asparagine synthase (glutamine-hydrolysing)
MCGLIGLVSPHGRSSEAELRALSERMSEALKHRGPDSKGVWVDQYSGVALAHRRLSVLDLTTAGRQPMHSASGRYVIVLNGEIYNFKKLRQAVESKLGSVGWVGHSDTEVLLEAIASWGLEETLKRVVGMFAFALWDTTKRELHLVRDRAGEKPLYYGWIGSQFAFSSELKGLRAIPGFDNAVDRNALALYMRYSAVPAPHCIYKNIFKLPPGCSITLTEHDLHSARLPEPKPFWSWLSVARDGIANPKDFESVDSAVEALDSVLREAIAGQMVADVPVGAFLSGGIDSSTVVALMQAQSMRPVKTFSIGFFERSYDEAQQAKQVAAHLGTEHFELYVTPEDAIGVIPRLSEIYCEPFSDSSQIPTLLVAELARKHVTVSLSGDAGDELFGGYNRHYVVAQSWSKMANIPKLLRRTTARLLRSLSPAVWEATYRAFRPVIPREYEMRMPGEKVYKAADSLESTSAYDLYQRLRSHWRPAEVVIGALERQDRSMDDAIGFPNVAEQMMALDGATYLPDDILVKLDRAAMSVSLETRVPFLDHRVVEFAWQLPLSMKLRNGQGKWILRQVLYKYVPRELVDRPKMGFAVPIDSWLGGPLRDWAESLLEVPRLKAEGYFNPEPIRQKWQEHISGRRNWQNHLWDVLMFQGWLEEQRHDGAD